MQMLCMWIGKGSSGRRVNRGAWQSFTSRFTAMVDLPFRIETAVAGIEPASGRLTAVYPYQHGSHRNKVRMVGFEPTISGAQNRRIPRLSYILLAKAPSGS